MKVAALFVETDGPYFGLRDVDPWGIERDARLYRGPHPVVAHPPCERWGRYWSGGPSAKVRRVKGDDGGCFQEALAAVRNYGGVLEHPEASHAFAHHGLVKPPKSGGWVRSDMGWVCCVEQGHYGHPARKATWLYAVGIDPPELIWGPAQGKRRLDEGYHSKEERERSTAAPRKRLSKKECVETPPAFRDLLILMARSVYAARIADALARTG